jgi:cyclopropane-fatty-acyl-phospholipid synthase
MEMLTETGYDRARHFQTLFEEYKGAPFAIRLWDGWSWNWPKDRLPLCTVTFKTPAAFAALMVKPSEITLGEAYLDGEIDLEGDIFSVFEIAEHLFRTPRARRKRVIEMLSFIAAEMVKRWTTGRSHSPNRDSQAISHHYDQPAAFYAPWLGDSWVYSCAYFGTPHDDLTTAQINKLSLICRKLRLQAGDRFLDIGCGWGSLVLHAAAEFKAYAQGITISHEQVAVARRRIESARLKQSCRVDLLDYRRAPATFTPFDRIASIGMFEHVGLKNLPRYFRTVYEILKPGGVFLNHGIACAAHARSGWFATWLNSIPILRRAGSSLFIEKYVFPEGELATISEALRAAEAAGFEVRDVDNLREHYELTLRAWVRGLQANASEVRRLVSEATYRTWLLYLAGSAVEFRRGDLIVYQPLLSRTNEGRSCLPLTRSDWYGCPPDERRGLVA